jgi:hypothetical protein
VFVFGVKTPKDQNWVFFFKSILIEKLLRFVKNRLIDKVMKMLENLINKLPLGYDFFK